MILLTIEENKSYQNRILPIYAKGNLVLMIAIKLHSSNTIL